MILRVHLRGLNGEQLLVLSAIVVTLVILVLLINRKSKSAGKSEVEDQQIPEDILRSTQIWKEYIENKNKN